MAGTRLTHVPYKGTRPALNELLGGQIQLMFSIVARWNGEIDRALQLPDVKERLAGNGMEPVGGSADRLRVVLERDVAKWRRVVETAGIKPGG
jgi:tripartite-type tricarboxylate transporter receptor subunit TctC